MYKIWHIIKQINNIENKVKYHIDTHIRVNEGPLTVFYENMNTINKEKQKMFITVIIFINK